MAKDKGHRTTERNLEKHSERAENYRSEAVKKQTRKDLGNNFKKKKKK